MKQLLLLLFCVSSFSLLAQEAFIHKASKSNIKMNYTTLSHPSCDGNPNAILTVTPNWKGVYNSHSVGVWYSNGMWTIYNEDKALMPINTYDKSFSG